MSSEAESEDPYLSAERTVELALAVLLLDEVTGDPPVPVRGDRPKALFRKFDAEPTLNADGYYVFRAIPPGTPTVTVKPGKRFFAPEDPVVVEADVRNSDRPVVEIPLAPTPAYEFSAGTTLVRGVLREPAPETEEDPEAVGPPITGASVALVGPAPPPPEGGEEGGGEDDTIVVNATKTTEKGEFVLYFPESDAWTVEDGEGEGGEVEGGEGGEVEGSEGGTGEGGEHEDAVDGRVVTIGGETPKIQVSRGESEPVSEAVTIVEGKTASVSLVLETDSLTVETISYR